MKEISSEHLAAIKERSEAATKGPWRWDVNPKFKAVELEAPWNGGTTIFCAKRWGMGGAQLQWCVPTSHGGIIHDMVEFLKPVPGREHHASWHQTIDHPNAVFIAEARADVPALLAHIEFLEDQLRKHKGRKDLVS